MRNRSAAIQELSQHKFLNRTAAATRPEMASDDSAGGGSILLRLLSCADCGEIMTLTHIMPDEPGYQRLTFRCETCHRSETVLVRTARES